MADRALWPSLSSPDRSMRHLLATLAIVAVAVGLAPASVDRASATWQPQAYDRAARRDTDFVRIEVYPANVRRQIERFRPGSIVLASFAETRKVASLVPVQSVEESELRELDADAPANGDAFVRWAGWRRSPGSERIPYDIEYVVARRDDPAFAGVVDYALECDWIDRSAGGLWILERDGRGCSASKVDEP